MNGHVVLIGDSIFDNSAYVPGGPSVIEHLRRILPTDWIATLIAVDGATILSIEPQLQRIPDGTTHLVLSVGGNDALGLSGHIFSQPADSYESALSGLATIRDEFSRQYLEMLRAVRSLRFPLAVCTIYDAVPGLTPAESVGLSIFNEVITKLVHASGSMLIDLRTICNEPCDYSAISPIEPSAAGGGKIARAIVSAVFPTGEIGRVIA